MIGEGKACLSYLSPFKYESKALICFYLYDVCVCMCVYVCAHRDGDEEDLADLQEKEQESKKKNNSSSSSTNQNSDQVAPPLTLKSISSKGRIVRSRWNTREVVQGRR